MELPKCDKRKKVNGMWMCYAIGCCEIGDMPCECEECMKDEGVKPSFCCHKLSHEKEDFSHKK